MRKSIPLLILVLLFAGKPGSGAEKAFSRSRWIREHMPFVEFSGGVLPIARPLSVPFLPEQPLAAMSVKNVRVSHDILGGSAPGAEPETQTEPMIAINPENPDNLLSAYQDNRFEDSGARGLTFAASFNSGRTWLEGVLPNLTVATGGTLERASDPWVAFGPGNHVYFASIAFNETTPLNGVFINISEDGGTTFGNPIAVTTSTAVFNDKESVVVDNGADSPFKGNIYVGWDSVSQDNRQPALISRSTDGGHSFSTPKKLTRAGINIGVVPVVAPNGTVYAFWSQVTFTSIRMVFSRSKNGGRRWSPISRIAQVPRGEVPGLRTGTTLIAPAVDPDTGDLYVGWQTAAPGGPVQVAITHSADRGKNWSSPITVSEPFSDRHCFNPALAINDAGELAVSYYCIPTTADRRFFADVFLSVSQDHGRTFGTPRRVTARSFDVRFAASVIAGQNARSFFLGDYQGLAAAPQSFHPLWIATFKRSRITSGKQPDAFTARVTP